MSAEVLWNVRCHEDVVFYAKTYTTQFSWYICACLWDVYTWILKQTTFSQKKDTAEHTTENLYFYSQIILE